MLLPLKLHGVYKETIWGGNRLKSEFGKECDLSNVAESWELCCHKNGVNTVVGGEYDGRRFDEVLKEWGNAAVGKKAEGLDRFPLLIKFIDAANKLSVQVHPNDEYARIHENELGKTEMWYVVDAAPGATLVVGFRRDITEDEFRAALKNGTLMDILNVVDIHKGDVVFIPSGMVHAIGAGALIVEIQENSDTTYRVYDYDRIGADGKPRALHVEKALAVANMKAHDNKIAHPEPQGEGSLRIARLASCNYFTVDLMVIDGSVVQNTDEDSFANYIVTEGEGNLVWEGGSIHFVKGDSLYVPAGLGRFALVGEAEIVRSTL